jgi:hypothetical protein
MSKLSCLGKYYPSINADRTMSILSQYRKADNKNPLNSADYVILSGGEGERHISSNGKLFIRI